MQIHTQIKAWAYQSFEGHTYVQHTYAYAYAQINTHTHQ